MSLPVIFVDLDGPLFSTRAMLLPENDPQSVKPEGLPKIIDTMCGYWKMDPVGVALLNKIYDITLCECVISSTWKDICDRDAMQALFDLNGLRLPFHDDWETPQVSLSYRRGEEILAWIEDHPEVTKWIAVDDDQLIAKFPKNHKCLVSEDDGILYKDYKHILE